jgi:hypothetical protein
VVSWLIDICGRETRGMGSDMGRIDLLPTGELGRCRDGESLSEAEVWDTPSQAGKRSRWDSLHPLALAPPTAFQQRRIRG